MTQLQQTKLLMDHLLMTGHPAVESRDQKVEKRKARSEVCSGGAHKPNFCEDGSCYCTRCFQEL